MDPRAFEDLRVRVEREPYPSNKIGLISSTFCAPNVLLFATQVHMLLSMLPPQHMPGYYGERLTALNLLVPRCTDLRMGDNATLLLSLFPSNHPEYQQAYSLLYAQPTSPPPYGQPPQPYGQPPQPYGQPPQPYGQPPQPYGQPPQPYGQPPQPYGQPPQPYPSPMPSFAPPPSPGQDQYGYYPSVPQMQVAPIVAPPQAPSIPPPVAVNHHQGPHFYINLRSFHRQYVVAENDHQTVRANRSSAGPWEAFLLTSVGGNRYTLKTHTGKYVCAEPSGQVVGNRDAAREWETWAVESRNGLVYFRSHHGKYLCAEPSGVLVANRDKCGDWEGFQLSLKSGQRIALKTHHGRFVCCEPTGKCVADRASRGMWELLEVCDGFEGRTAFKSHHQKFICTENTHVVKADRAAAREWESYAVELHNDGKIALFNHHKRYMCAEANHSLIGNRDRVGPWEQFSVVSA